MAKKIETIVSIDGKEATKTLRDLCTEIDNYKKKLSELEKPASKYKETLSKLSTALDKLNGLLEKANTTVQNLNNTIGTVQTTTQTYKTTLEKLRDLVSDYIVEAGTLQDTTTQYKQSLSETTQKQEEYEASLRNTAKAQGEVNTVCTQATTTIIELNSTLDKTSAAQNKQTNSLIALRTEIKDYKDELDKLQEKATEYEVTLHNLALAQKEVDNVSKDSKKSTKENKDEFASLVTALGDVHKGFVAVKDMAKLLGIESEIVNKAFVQLQASMALVQNIGTLAKGIQAVNVAFKAFNATLMSNPIMLLVGVLIILIATIAKLVDAMATDLSGTKELKEEHEKFISTINKEKDALSKNQDLLRAQGKSQKEIAQYTRDATAAIKKSIDERIADSEREIAQLQKNISWWNFAQKKKLEQLKENVKGLKEEQGKADKELETANHNLEVAVTQEQTDGHKKRLDAAKQAAEERKRLEEQLKKDLVDIEKRYNKSLEDFEKEREERMNKEEEIYTTNMLGREVYLKSAIASNKLLQQETQATMGDLEKSIKSLNAIPVENKTAEQVEELKNKTEEHIKKQQELSDLYREQETLTKEREDILKNLKATEENYTEIVKNRNVAEAEKLRLEGLENAKDKEKLIADKEKLAADLLEQEAEEEKYTEEKARIASLLEDEQLSADKKTELMNDYMKNLSKLEAAEKKVANTQKDIDNIDKKLKEDKKKRLDATLDQTKKFLTESTKLVGENTVAGKAMAVAGATIDTFKAGTLALSSYPPPANFIALAATIATGLATVKSILSTKVPGASDNSSAAAATVPLPDMPEMDADFVETHNNLDGKQEEKLNTQTVLVVEDVNDVQARVQVAETKATF